MANKAALIKLSALANPVLTKDYVLEQSGVWLEGAIIANELTKKSLHEGLPSGLEANPSVFIPFSQIEWLVTPERTSKKTSADEE